MQSRKFLLAFPAIVKAIPSRVTPASRPLQVSFPPCGVFVIESRHAQDFRMDWTQHHFTKLLYVFEGRGRLLTPGGAFPLNPGRVALVPSGQKHRISDDEPLSLYVLCLRESILPTTRTGMTCRSAGHPALREMAEGSLCEMLYEQTTRHPGWESIVAGKALMLWGSWMRSQSGHKEMSPRFRAGTSHHRVEAYIAELQQSFYRSETLEDAARHCGLGIRRFTQIFRELTGTSWLNFVRELRITHARRLLQATSRSIVSVCFECGFEDLSNFYRAFRKSCGMSPQRWRENQAAEKRT